MKGAACAAALLGIALAGCGGKATVAATPSKALPPANPQAVVKMVQGAQAAKDGARDRAVALLREAVALDGALWEARYDLGLVLAARGELGGAEEQLEAAAKVAPDAGEVALALGEVRRRRGAHKAAAEGLGAFLERTPDASDVRALYVASLRDAGALDRAVKEAREALVQRPADAAALAELALCHLAKGERETAQLLARQAQDANPKSAAAHRALGLVALASGDDAGAFQAFSRATQEDPHDTTARLNVAHVLLRAGAYAKAEEQYRAVLKVAPDDTDAAVGLAAAVRGQGDAAHPARFGEARRLLEGVLEREPHHLSALFNLGVLLADHLKRPEEARPYFQRFLADAPEGHAARAHASQYVAALSAVTKDAKPAEAPAPAQDAAPAKTGRGGAR